METLNNFESQHTFPLMLFIGIALRLIIGMRQFNRRGLGGLQHFPNYFIGILTLFFEWVLKWTANIMMVLGLLGWIANT